METALKSVLRRALAVAVFLFAATAQADVRESAPDSFFLAWSEPVASTPQHAWTALLAVSSWWSDEHTWSGHASNLSLQAQAGGCFCERWPAGSAEHGRVVMALPGDLLRLEAALGPLQERALKGILGFWIRSNDDGSTRIDVEYRVNGAAASGLDALAPQVDAVLGAQVARLKRYVDTGDADPPPTPSEAAASVTASPEVARAALLEQWKREAEAASGIRAPESRPAKTKPGKRDPAPKP